MASVKPIPANHHSETPYLIIQDAFSDFGPCAKLYKREFLQKFLQKRSSSKKTRCERLVVTTFFKFSKSKNNNILNQIQTKLNL